ncbi:MAG TPA: hypothetical protein DCS07_14715 [Bdellovibrionales bacterium]|nr:MAG: hypothetical protein A2Z97_07395 [Bdellovibrionales bacterium GWB1_52_6]OFZ06515.1 MAG: hypothetical protein A2X97_16990 [Bdellovibrionales bacterium GWA1_52_35]OFZ42281.1 MAG: hypothetical protein A2070_06545 [Bdellovibrionales bacterium GWC1_52_8]HAR43863.1 hypothetical protein [Bdellovibrionales bacterium]HCM39519.1 hypothetical protein [Bdellovibrionales bacterium]
MIKVISILAILILSCGFYSCAESCLKNYTLTGTITNSNSTPLEGVEVRWRNSPSTILGKTNAQGKYSIPYETQAALDGGTLEFYLAGYQVALANAYSNEEAGPDKCGEIALSRNATLWP